ncbi:hypothetical protein [Crocosphaera sp.]|uniref:hypothetical protein n=1 Tax=Crocosphaera sp. TaxID=2729996 RepID=UPI003F23EF80|nr:hypothetical protein [Crocosphaera sp.]
MESSSPSGKVSEPPAHRWTHIMGIAIAMLTLIVPILVIAYYSSNPATRFQVENMQKWTNVDGSQPDMNPERQTKTGVR